MSVDIVSLQCPVCGAPFSPSDEKCGYCGSILMLRTDHPKINPLNLNRLVVDKHIAEYRQDLRRDPGDTTAHYGLGVAYFNLGLTDDSVRELEEAARLMPENPNIQSQLAVVLKEALDEGRPGAAQKLRDRIQYTLRLDPDNYDALLLKAETDATLSDFESLDLLERAYKPHPERTTTRLTTALVKMAAARETVGTDAEIELLRRANHLDPKTARSPLFNAILRRAELSSRSDPAADIQDPTRSAKALHYWQDLFAIDSPLAQTRISSYLHALPEMSRADRKRLRALTDNPGESPVSGDESTARTEPAGTFGRFGKPILTGLLKALGMLIGIFILFGIVSNVSGLSTIVALVFLLALVVLPLLMPILEVRKVAGDVAKLAPTTLSLTDMPHTPGVTDRDRQRYLAYLRLLRSCFTQRWGKQSVERVKLDSSKLGVKVERHRHKAFLASMTK